MSQIDPLNQFQKAIKFKFQPTSKLELTSDATLSALIFALTWLLFSSVITVRVQRFRLDVVDFVSNSLAIVILLGIGHGGCSVSQPPRGAKTCNRNKLSFKFNAFGQDYLRPPVRLVELAAKPPALVAPAWTPPRLSNCTFISH